MVSAFLFSDHSWYVPDLYLPFWDDVCERSVDDGDVVSVVLVLQYWSYTV